MVEQPLDNHFLLFPWAFDSIDRSRFGLVETSRVGCCTMDAVFRRDRDCGFCHGLVLSRGKIRSGSNRGLFFCDIAVWIGIGVGGQGTFSRIIFSNFVSFFDGAFEFLGGTGRGAVTTFNGLVFGGGVECGGYCHAARGYRDLFECVSV